MEFFVGKTLLITGATGYLGKVLVEKILRTQPNVKKLFVLIRAHNSESARQRFQKEVLSCELFKVIKEKFGGDIISLVEEKVVPVAGDISFEDLRIESPEEITREVDIIINSAATVKFDERYDVAIGINTFGAMNVLKFAKKCLNVKMLIHVSTAFVCGEKSGVIPEKAFHLGETLNGSSCLDIDVERKVIEERIIELQTQNSSEKQVRSAMKDLGLQRAKLHGWPNTYSFTKVMGEMLLLASKGNMKLVILRPTYITATYKEPFPGWTEGIKTSDIFIVLYGKGITNSFFVDPNSMMDVIPSDMVVNSLLSAIVEHDHSSSQDFIIYHIGSSWRNPTSYSDLLNFMFRYFTNNPFATGKLLKVEKPLVQPMTPTNLERATGLVKRVADLYKPYAFFYGRFEDTNTERLRMLISKRAGNNNEVLNFDPKCIQWEDYFLNAYIPGVVKYTFGGDQRKGGPSTSSKTTKMSKL